MVCNVGFAEKKSLIDIKIGDKITEHFSTNQIIEYYVDDDVTEEDIRVYGKNYKYSFIAFVNDGTFEDYDYIQVYYETKTDKIVSTTGIYEMSDESDCISKRNKLASEYKKIKRRKKQGAGWGAAAQFYIVLSVINIALKLVILVVNL